MAKSAKKTTSTSTAATSTTSAPPADSAGPAATSPATTSPTASTQAERAERRKEVAERVRELGGSILAAADKLGLNYNYVYSACKEFGVATPKINTVFDGPSRTLTMIADFLDGYSVGEVADRNSVTKQRASSLLKQITAAGIMRHAKVPAGECDEMIAAAQVLAEKKVAKEARAAKKKRASGKEE